MPQELIGGLLGAGLAALINDNLHPPVFLPVRLGIVRSLGLGVGSGGLMLAALSSTISGDLSLRGLRKLYRHRGWPPSASGLALGAGEVGKEHLFEDSGLKKKSLKATRKALPN